jgi:hypothetical protein
MMVLCFAVNAVHLINIQLLNLNVKQVSGQKTKKTSNSLDSKVIDLSFTSGVALPKLISKVRSLSDFETWDQRMNRILCLI